MVPTPPKAMKDGFACVFFMDDVIERDFGEQAIAAGGWEGIRGAEPQNIEQ